MPPDPTASPQPDPALLLALVRERDWRRVAAFLATLEPAARSGLAAGPLLSEALHAALRDQDAEAVAGWSRLFLEATEGAQGLTLNVAQFLHVTGRRAEALACYGRLIAAGEEAAVPMAAMLLAGAGRYEEALAYLAGSPAHRGSDHHLALLSAARRFGEASALAMARFHASDRTVADHVAAIDWLVRSGAPDLALALINAAPPEVRTDRTIGWYRRLYAFLVARTARLAAIPAPQAGPRDLLISVIAWGQAYAERLGAVTLASLAAPGNFPAFARDRKVTLRIYTDFVGRMILQRAEALRALQGNIAIEFEIIPPDLLQMQGLAMPITPRYLLLGLFAHLSLIEAGASGRDAMLLGADCIYSGGFCRHLAGLVAEGREIISVSVGFSANESLLTALGPWRSGAVIDIAAPDLVDLGFAYLNHRTISLTVDPKADRRSSMPAIMFFRTAEGLAYRKLGVDLTYVANDAIRRAGPFDYLTPDGEMADRLVSPADWHRIHRVTDSRDAVLVELIPDAERFPEIAGAPLDPLHVVDYADKYGFLNYMRHCFLHETRLTGTKPPPWAGDDHGDFVERTRRLLFDL